MSWVGPADRTAGSVRNEHRTQHDFARNGRQIGGVSDLAADAATSESLRFRPRDARAALLPVEARVEELSDLRDSHDTLNDEAISSNIGAKFFASSDAVVNEIVSSVPSMMVRYWICASASVPPGS